MSDVKLTATTITDEHLRALIVWLANAQLNVGIARLGNEQIHTATLRAEVMAARGRCAAAVNALGLATTEAGSTR